MNIISPISLIPVPDSNDPELTFQRQKLCVQADLYMPDNSHETISIPLDMPFSIIKQQVARRIHSDPLYIALFAGCDYLDDGDTWSNCSALVPFRGGPEATCLPLSVALTVVILSPLTLNIQFSGRSTMVSCYQYDYCSSLIETAIHDLSLPGDSNNYHLSLRGTPFINTLTIYGARLQNNELLQLEEGEYSPDVIQFQVRCSPRVYSITAPTDITVSDFISRLIQTFHISSAGRTLLHSGIALQHTDTLSDALQLPAPPTTGTIIITLDYELDVLGGITFSSFNST